MKKINLFLLITVGFFFTAAKKDKIVLQPNEISQKISGANKSNTDVAVTASRTTSTDDFFIYEKQADKLTLVELEAEITKTEDLLGRFSDYEYEQFSTVQLHEFNTLNQKKTALLKKLIFKKFAVKKYIGKL